MHQQRMIWQQYSALVIVKIEIVRVCICLFTLFSASPPKTCIFPSPLILLSITFTFYILDIRIFLFFSTFLYSFVPLNVQHARDTHSAIHSLLNGNCWENCQYETHMSPYYIIVLQNYYNNDNIYSYNMVYSSKYTYTYTCIMETMLMCRYSPGNLLILHIPSHARSDVILG